MVQHSAALAQLLGEILASKKWHVTCAESCTGGGLGYAITAVPGSSAWFDRGFITYSNEAKSVLLGLDILDIERQGAVSLQTVEAMAKGAALAAKAQCSIAISGIAGPDGGSADKPVGTVCFGFVVDGRIYTSTQIFSGDRQQVRVSAINFSLKHLLELLQQ